MSDTIKEKVGAIISVTVKENQGLDVDLTNDQSLINDGILDSINIVKVVQVLQKEFDIEITAADITLDNFDTISAIIGFVKTRLE
jgi:D-alanine--poly(phosphoribitol) ligase subunit 2